MSSQRAVRMGCFGKMANIGKMICIVCISLSLMSCGGSNDPDYTISVTVSGLEGSVLVLQNNASDDLNVSEDGTYTFAGSIERGDSYAVTVQSQPNNPTQTCTVNDGTGQVSNADITGVTIVCSTSSYNIIATVSGLDSIVPSGSGLTLQNNADDDLVITTNGSFTFSIPVASGADYLITARTQPSTSPAQSCLITDPSGTITDSGVSVAVTCGPAYVLPTTSTEISLEAKGVLVDGDTIYVTTGTEFKVFDVSDPLAPLLIGTVVHGFSDLRVEPHVISNDIVWCIRSSSGGLGLSTYVYGVDVSDPTNPVVRGMLTLQTGTSLLSSVSVLYEEYLLVHDYSDNFIYVIDVSNPDAPVKYSQWSVPNMVSGGPGMMAVEGTLLYLLCGQSSVFNIYNLADLTSVSLVGSVGIGAEAYGPVAKQGSYVYLYSSVFGGPKYFNVVDVSDPAAPVLVSRQDPTGYPILKNGKLFTFDGNVVTAYSLIDPENPVVENSSIVATPSPLHLYALSYPSAAWVGNYLIGMTYSDSALTHGARALEFPVY